jgi:hypothetical protein
MSFDREHSRCRRRGCRHYHPGSDGALVPVNVVVREAVSRAPRRSPLASPYPIGDAPAGDTEVDADEDAREDGADQQWNDLESAIRYFQRRVRERSNEVMGLDCRCPRLVAPPRR